MCFMSEKMVSFICYNDVGQYFRILVITFGNSFAQQYQSALPYILT